VIDHPLPAFLAAVIALAAAALVFGSQEESRMKDLELLGLKVRDRATGFVGVVSSVSYDLYGCISAVVAPPVDEKGALPDGKWFDTSRLEVLDPVPVMEIPGGRFAVTRSASPAPSTDRPGPAEKPAR
jgi:hypothetical protein